jgi:hypothetical protein
MSPHRTFHTILYGVFGARLFSRGLALVNEIEPHVLFDMSIEGVVG